MPTRKTTSTMMQYTQMPDSPERRDAMHIPENIRAEIGAYGISVYDWITPREYWMALQKYMLERLHFVNMGIFATPIVYLLGAMLFVPEIQFVVPTWHGGINGLLPQLEFTWFCLLFFLSALVMSGAYSVSKRYLSASKIIFTHRAIISHRTIGNYEKNSPFVHGLVDLGTYFEEPIFASSQLSERNKDLFGAWISKIREQIKQLVNGLRKDKSDPSSDKGDFAGAILFVMALLFSQGNTYIFGGLLVASFILFAAKHLWNLVSLIASLIGYAILVPISFVIGSAFLGVIKAVLSVTQRRFQTMRRTLLSLANLAGQLHERKASAIRTLRKGKTSEFQKAMAGLATTVDNATTDIRTLTDLLSDEDFRELFDVPGYSAWVRAQVREPMEELIRAVEESAMELKSGRERLEEQINTTTDAQLRAPLHLQLERIKAQAGELGANQALISQKLELIRI